jgi:hypothetical protein
MNIRRFLRTLLQLLVTPAALAVFFGALFSNAAAAAGPCLLLAPSETSIKPGATVELTVYLYNPGPSRIEAPSLELLSLTFTVDDPGGKHFGKAGGTKEISTGPMRKQTLEPRGVERRTINLEIPAEPGDLVKIYAELGKKPVLRINSVLLFCPPKE